MRTPLILVKAIGKVASHLCLQESAIFGDIAVDMTTEMANNVWSELTKDRRGEKKQAELRALLRTEMAEVIQLSNAEALEQMRLIAQEVAGEASGQAQEQLALYLNQIPGLMRQTMRRLDDPTGRTVRPDLSLEQPLDLLPLIPAGPPRFQPGDRPLQGVDLTLVEPLGAGAFGEVWKARHSHFPDDHQPVALKFCTDPAAKERLLKHEAGICLRVQRQGRHPGIVTLRQTYLSADPPCLATMATSTPRRLVRSPRTPGASTT